MSHHRTAESYSNNARDYEQKWQKYLSHTSAKLLEHFQSTGDYHILDVSAGTGFFENRMIEKKMPFSRITLNDVSEGMLEIAQDRFSNREDFSFSKNPVENLSFESSTFNAVISLNSFHNYKNKQKALSEIYRVMKPGGRLYLLDWNRKGFFRIINFFIKLFAKELIITLSKEKVKEQLQSASFEIKLAEEWKFSYWNFFLYVAEKTPTIQQQAFIYK